MFIDEYNNVQISFGKSFISYVNIALFGKLSWITILAHTSTTSIFQFNDACELAQSPVSVNK